MTNPTPIRPLLQAATAQAADGIATRARHRAQVRAARAAQRIERWLDDEMYALAAWARMREARWRP